MKKILSILGILVIIAIILYNSNQTQTANSSLDTSNLEYRIEELEGEVSHLEEENDSLESRLEDANKQLEIKDEYIEELQQLLEDNGIDEWEGIDTTLTDENGNPVPPSKNNQDGIKIEKDR